MGCQKAEETPEETSPLDNFKAPFSILSTTLLSLLLPLSFILLARLSLLNAISAKPSDSPAFLSRLIVWFVRYFDPPFLYATISTVSVSALFHGLTSGVEESPETNDQSKLTIAWILLICLQLCVGLGIEATLAIDSSWYRVFSNETSSWTRFALFLGLLEIMLFWSKTFVKPVVDDTVYGRPREERWIQRGLMAAALGGLWWLCLKEDVDLLVTLSAVRKDVKLNAFADFTAWWLYYVTVTIGIVRGVKVFASVVVSLVFRREREKLRWEDDPIFTF